MNNTNNAQITEGPVWKGLLTFFFPILFGTFFLLLYNTTDAVIVGHFLGKDALAAIGGGTAVYVNLLVGFFVGISSGSSVIISQFYGAHNDTEVQRSVHTAIMMALIAGTIMTIAGLIISPWAMQLIKTPPEIFADSVIYLRVYFYGMISLFIYNMGAGILRAVGDSKTPFYSLIVGCITNIFLDLLSIVILHQGVAGVAWATVLSQSISMILILFVLAKSRSSYQLHLSQIGITPHLLAKMIRIGIPAGMQSILYTISNLIIQANINIFGTDTIAAWAAYSKIDAIFWMTSNSFGVALTSFVGQNFGAGKIDRIRRATKEGIIMSGAMAIVYGLIFWFAGTTIFHLFTKDESVITIGMHMLYFLVPFFITYEPIEILSGVTRGTGAAFTPMLITCFGVCALRILWLAIAVPCNPTIRTVLACYPVTWIFTTILFIIYYKSNSWLHHHIMGK
ncbi:MAG: MATE family efflux transporter [Treponema sp.]|nr:MATE family efflux transporter [Treponema sp.]